MDILRRQAVRGLQEGRIRVCKPALLLHHGQRDTWPTATLLVYLPINPKAVRREMSGYYQCQVIRAAEEGAGVLEAGVHVEVTVTDDGQEHQDTLATPRFVTPTSSAYSHQLFF